MKRGFTLIELLVSVVILGIVSVLIVQVFFATIKTNTKEEVLRDTKQNGDYAMEVMTRMIRNARAIESGCTDDGVDSQTVLLRNRDGGTSTLGCALRDGRTSIASVSGEEAETVDYLTGENVFLSGQTCTDSTLRFTCTSVSGVPASVQILFTLWQAGEAVEMSIERAHTDFVTTVSLRN